MNGLSETVMEAAVAGVMEAAGVKGTGSCQSKIDLMSTVEPDSCTNYINSLSTDKKAKKIPDDKKELKLQFQLRQQ